ncbi:ABC transporter ATP-binding protein [Parablautia intestinalis]|uniref:ABC transporter ATP-binding protein n=1 Tax=Parablautia intestinalis TaxID=2320100 RepID=A0A3A9AFX1_9FIRM|nr:ABC transporter ATP-binding protein [Parablautia intestinalis]MDE7047834.1 ABC transporter ATP-binding protein [Lachnospiraceae bacterium]RKI90287.1 ABC transporter ATP-binding protein [Parablautia intestinalis]
MNVLAEITNLTKIYDKNKMALDHMNLTIPRGKIIGLLGPNGSGKTTLIKLMNGLLEATEGEVLINGCRPGPETKSVISYLPERTYFQNNMKVSELISFFCDFYKDFRPERARQMLANLNINEDAKLKTLSKGTKEKVQLIMVMSREAQLYVLDEPIAGVDPAARDYILRTIITNYNENATVLLSTHLISDIEKVLDEVIFIRSGRVILQDTVENIREYRGKSVDAYFREVFAC